MSFCGNLYKIGDFFDATAATIILIVYAETAGYRLWTCNAGPSQFMDIRFPDSLAYTDVHL